MIGIRREDKSKWEGRVPLVPADVQRLIDEHGLRFQVQQSPIRVFQDTEYQRAGAAVTEDLQDCPLIMGVKEIPPEKLKPDTVYVYFAHVIKGQPANMPALKRMLELNCTLIDYERIMDEEDRRLVFFGRYAGLAGMIDTLWAFGQRLRHEGIKNPFTRIQPAHRYEDLEHAQRELSAVAEDIRAHGLPAELHPLICGFAGYGQVSQGAQSIYDLLPVREITPSELGSVAADAHTCYKVVFREEHLVTRRQADQPFELQEYYRHPERYQGTFFPAARHLHILVNCIYWEPKYPRLIDAGQFRELYTGQPPRLRVIGDISCDIDGSLACTTRTTDPTDPVYVYDPQTRETHNGVVGKGPVVLAVDFLPCELPVDASNYFSRTLCPFIPGLAKADYSRTLTDSGLPPELRRAVIVYRGALTEPYKYLEQYLQDD